MKHVTGINTRGILAGLTLLFLASLSVAQQVEVKKVGIKNVYPATGEKMYTAYCAVCHGKDGRGGGPAAPAMKIPPANLTALAKSNGGKFPALRVSNVIVGDTARPQIHGDKDMPAWGTMFMQMSSGTEATAQADARMRVARLTDYVKSLQQR